MSFSIRRAPSLAVGLALLAGAILAGSPASAQAPDDGKGGMRCVYNKLTANRGYEVVAQVFLTDAVPESQVGQATRILDIATRACTETHRWSGSRAASGSDIGLYGGTIDYVMTLLHDAGADESAVSRFRDFVLAMSDDDYQPFADQDWRSDLAFTRRLRAIALEAGLPDTDAAMDLALDALEVGARLDYAVSLFELDLAHSE